MLIRQPKHDLPIGTGHHIVPGIPLHTADLAAEGQTRHGLQHLVRIGRGLRVPDQRVLVRARRADHVPPVGAEAHVALAGDGAAGRVRGRGARAGAAAGEEGFDVAGEGVEEEVARGGVGADEEGFAVVGEVQFRPVAVVGGVGAALGEGGGEGVFGLVQVEGGEGGFVVVAEVVEEDGGGAGAGDGDDGRGGVVGRQVRGREVESALGGGGREGPEAYGVVEGAGEEGVAGGAEGEGGDGGGVAFEVAQELVVVRGEVADGVVDFGAGVDDRLRVVREAGEVGAVFLGEERFDQLAFFGVVELQRFVVAGGQQEFARVVEVERCD